LHFVAIVDHILIHTAAMILLTFDVSVLFHEPSMRQAVTVMHCN